MYYYIRQGYTVFTFVCLCVGYMGETCENGWIDLCAVWRQISVGQAIGLPRITIKAREYVYAKIEYVSVKK